MEVPFYVVREFNKFDGWYQIYGPDSAPSCMEWMKANGKSPKEDVEKGYAKVFPANTAMLNWGYGNGD
jgi:hypothetical protein